MNITGIESCQAPSSPVMAFVEPGPVVTTAQPISSVTFASSSFENIHSLFPSILAKLFYMIFSGEDSIF